MDYTVSRKLAYSWILSRAHDFKSNACLWKGCVCLCVCMYLQLIPELPVGYSASPPVADPARETPEETTSKPFLDPICQKIA